MPKAYWSGKIKGAGRRQVKCVQCATPCVKTIGINEDDPAGCIDESKRSKSMHNQTMVAQPA